MSNSEPSAIVLQGIPCMRGLYAIRKEKTVSLKVAAIHPFPFDPSFLPAASRLFRAQHGNRIDPHRPHHRRQCGQ